MTFKVTETAETRFWRFVEKTDSCWNWMGSTNSNGRGQFWFDGKLGLASRFSWRLHHGNVAVPPDVMVLHECDNPRCVRPGPEHMYLGDHALRDMAERKRNFRHRDPERFFEHSRRIAPRTLTEQIVRQVRASAASGINYADLGRLYGISDVHARDLVLRKKWAWLP